MAAGGDLFTKLVGLYGLSFWLPFVIRASGVRDVSTIGWLSAIPYVVAMPVIVVSGITADRTGWRRLHSRASCCWAPSRSH